MPHRSRFDRREFLARSALVAFAPTVPAFLSRTVRAADTKDDGRILVVIQLSGGNDGINTVVPFADEGYAKCRDKLRLETDRLLTVNDEVGLHPSLRPAADLLEDGRLAIVQGVGYPNPNRSHDVSMAIWHTARFDPEEHKSFGWIGRAMDVAPRPLGGAPHVMLLGDENPPLAIQGRRSTSVALAHLQDLTLHGSKRAGLAAADFQDKRIPAVPAATDDLAAFVRRSTLDAYATAELLDSTTRNAVEERSRYPSTQLGERLSMIARLIKAGFGTPVYYAIQGGYDTHSVQLPAHARLLRELAGALKSFLDDLKSASLDERVLVLCFSEFGRRAQENASLGTDHGTAAPVFVAGPKVKAGLIGRTPSMTDLEEGDLKMGIDFRRVYAAILQNWLGLPSEATRARSFKPLTELLGL